MVVHVRKCVRWKPRKVCGMRLGKRVCRRACAKFRELR